MQTLSEQIAAKEAELAAVRAVLESTYGSSVGGSSRRKQFAVRVDADIRRSAERWATVKRLESEIAALRRKADKPEASPLDLSRLPYARYIRTWAGWHEVVKVNRATVKVVAAPGMDDLVKIGKILEIREWPTPAAETAA